MKKLLLLFFLIPFLGFSQIQIGQDINGEQGRLYNDFGASVSSSLDGSIVAIGSPLTNVNGENSGSVKVYENIGGVWTQIGNNIEGESAMDQFGHSVSLSLDGSVLAVGAIGQGVNGDNSGYVKIFENVNGNWTQIGANVVGVSANDQFGYSLCLSSNGNVIAIGARNNDNNGTNSGHARIFENINGVWIQVGNDINGEQTGDFSGNSISLSSDGNIVAIGARFNDGNGNRSGHVRIFENVSNNWVQLGSDIDGEDAGDRSGHSVSLSSNGNVVAIGANWNAENGFISGHVRIHEYTNGNWTQIGNDIDGEDSANFFGESVSLSSDGSKVAIGATGNDNNGINSGHVKIYENIGGIWTQVGGEIGGEAVSDQSGNSVSLSSDGNTVIIGAKYNDGNGYDSGHARIFEDIGGNWIQVGNDIDGDRTYSSDQLGYSTSISSDGNIIALASNNKDNGIQNIKAGQVIIYENSNGSWTQLGNRIDGEASFDYSGSSISLSSDGSIIAIGATNNDDNGQDSGHVRVYENLGGVWTQIGNDINGEAALDSSGISVDLSLDGTIVAIGAFFNDGNGQDSGHVRVYENLGGVWTQIGNDIDGDALFNRSGSDLSLSSDGNFIAIGATLNSNNGDSSGHVRVYENLSGIWIQKGNDIQGEELDRLGFHVDMSSDGNTIAVGAQESDGVDPEITRIFEYSNGSWIQKGNDIVGEAVLDFEGGSLSLAPNGEVVAIGYPLLNGNTESSGQVRIYEFTQGIWTEIGNYINGQITGDQFGHSLAISGNGRLVIGSPGNDVNGENSGQAKVYDFSTLLSTKESELSDFKIFPNPTNNQVTIQLGNGTELQNATIYNNFGQLVLTSKEITINTSKLASGLYVVEVETNKGKGSKKLIID
ncbi:T9SS type A sorting domain-containing protein [Winogradskyella flava]|uniref:T9SS type A sorting domain-containing protein n=1 Tax=Winogradskyella flava TaxID=1884876 RepID=A0A842INW6_9FLAO|nr:T9SS type A sorting domain-containing protein [Winogradskyella flava]MBC2843899.1 T9SS type A sorting domain-containing protein [Winogradskyella flava]